MNNQVLILKYNRNYKGYMCFNNQTQETKVFEQEGEIKSDGTYGYIAGVSFLIFGKKERILFYRIGNCLYINVRNKEFFLNDEIQLVFKRKLMLVTFKVFYKSKKVFSITYLSYQFFLLNLMDIDFTEDREEDQDICLFIYNVTNDPERLQFVCTDTSQ
ncbi:hypothetical protein IC620_15060 [Hazenella sp. IB182357]|uniref:Uncharacterized protein n=1 Tax=Polycladospora coralii TaxID=2771432 RepID=A0A926RU85_9BACL|nr:hypothetical protein [Polycladospora coralii]MBD1373665.1 hypothetical protein [Polycladospora coralii]